MCYHLHKLSTFLQHGSLRIEVAGHTLLRLREIIKRVAETTKECRLEIDAEESEIMGFQIHEAIRPRTYGCVPYMVPRREIQRHHAYRESASA